MKVKCYKCGYKGSISGNAHIQCNFDWDKSGNSTPKGSLYGIQRGWYFFPLNYDPIWMEDECQFFSTEIDLTKIKIEYDPLDKILAMLWNK